MYDHSLIVKHYRPKLLDRYIDSIDVYHFGKDKEILLHTKGVFEMVFQSNESFQHNTSYSSGWTTRPKNFIGGLHSKSYSIKPTGNQNLCIAIAFKPNTAKYFIPQKLNNFQNKLIEISEVWKDSNDLLIREMEQKGNDRDKINAIESFLAKKNHYS